MDFERAIWELGTLIVMPRKVYRNVYFQKRRSPTNHLVLTTEQNGNQKQRTNGQEMILPFLYFCVASLFARQFLGLSSRISPS
ncbi:hypothetical protein FRC14_002758 [Serendipita sp. 396]|nr:hypothetical protein FRC14_002758 [Serendipita sp. 396]KAG9054414.1 hypothetical protein FS842_005190 [Serendipita sp. 407]